MRSVARKYHLLQGFIQSIVAFNISFFFLELKDKFPKSNVCVKTKSVLFNR